jgi:hypothetical protein
LIGTGPDVTAAVGFQQAAGIGAVGSVATDIGPDIMGGQQHDLMTKALKAPGPVMGRPAGLHHDAQRRPCVESARKGGTTQPLAFDDRSAGIGEGQLEDVLGEVDGDAHRRRSGRIVRGDGDSMHGGRLL